MYLRVFVKKRLLCGLAAGANKRGKTGEAGYVFFPTGHLLANQDHSESIAKILSPLPEKDITPLLYVKGCVVYVLFIFLLRHGRTEAL